MFNSLHNLVIAGTLLLTSSGCAVFSTQQYDLSSAYMSQELPDADLQYGFGDSGSWPGGWQLNPTIHIPLVLFLDYDRPPWTVWIDVRDRSRNYETLHVDSVQFSWLETGEEFVQLVNEDRRFRETSDGHWETDYFLEDRIDRIEPVQVKIRGRALRVDGSHVPVEFARILRPESETEVICPIWHFYAS